MTIHTSSTEPQPSTAGSAAQGSSITMEELLSLRPPTDSGATIAAVAQVRQEVGHTHSTPSTTPAAQPRGAEPMASHRLLFIHGSSEESTLIQTWIQRAFAGGHWQEARFQGYPAEQLRRHAPQAVFIHYDPGHLDVAVALSSELQVLHPQIPRIAVGHAKYPQCVLAALRSGVQEFLDVDGELESAQQTVQALLQRAPVVPSQAPNAALTTIISARAGMGSSLLASHLAWYVQQQLAASPATAGAKLKDRDPQALHTLLLDLGQPRSDCALYLNTAVDFDFLKATGNLRRFDRRMAVSALARHHSGLRLLCPPPPPTPMHEIPSADVDELLRRLRQYFLHLVVDLGAEAVSALSASIAQQATEIWVVCDQTVASVVSTAELLRQLEALQIPRERLQLLVNRHDRVLELEAQQIAQQLQLPLLATLPDRRRELARATNQGQLLSQRQEPYVQAVGKLASDLLGRHHPEAARTRTEPSGQLTRMLQQLKSTLTTS